ncbi:MAG TPA: IS66 family transposase [Polyangiales bacterium]|nr:IS66 family transposase [Polyangiales bacterium]
MELPLWGKKDAANDDQAAAKDDGPAANDGKPPERTKPKKRGPTTKHRHGRTKLPDHLERKPQQHFVDETKRACPCCSSQTSHMKFLAGGERLDVEPARFVVRVDHMEMRACQHCDDYIVTTPRPDNIVDRGALGDDLIVESTVDHYEDGVPWERMQRRAREQRVPLSANTLAAASGRAVDLLAPIVRHIFDKALQSQYFGFDATGVRVLDVSHPLGIRSGVMWLLQGDHVYSCFKYADSGHAHHLKALLRGATFATAMCDGSPTNNCVERHGATRGGCNAHARRKLVEALRVGDTRAMEGLELFARIFHVDAEAKRAGETVEQRFARRQRDSAPIVADLENWMKARRRDVEPKSPLGRAVRYMDKQWTRLTAFLSDPLLELSNNEVERDLRTWVLSRNYAEFRIMRRSSALGAKTRLIVCKEAEHNQRASRNARRSSLGAKRRRRWTGSTSLSSARFFIRRSASM